MRMNETRIQLNVFDSMGYLPAREIGKSSSSTKNKVFCEIRFIFQETKVRCICRHLGEL